MANPAQAAAYQAYVAQAQQQALAGLAGLTAPPVPVLPGFAGVAAMSPAGVPGPSNAAAQQPPAKGPTGNPVCRMWYSSQTCKFGDTCKFDHITGGVLLPKNSAAMQAPAVAPPQPNPVGGQIVVQNVAPGCELVIVN